MNSVVVSQEVTPTLIPQAQARWYALHTRARHEKKVATQLRERGIISFAPTVRKLQQWSDRRQEVELPLFSSYVFVQVADWRDVYLPVLCLTSVLHWVRLNREQPSVLPDAEIDALRTITANRLPLFKHPYLRIGQRVRLRSGCLDGVQGVLVERKGSATLVVSIHLLQQSVAVSVDGYEVEAA